MMDEITDLNALRQLIGLEARGFDRADTPDEKSRRAGRLAMYARRYHIITSEGPAPEGYEHGD